MRTRPAQFGVGLYGYLVPQLPLAQRRALGPWHKFAGRATYVTALATMLVRMRAQMCVRECMRFPHVWACMPCIVHLMCEGQVL